MSRLFLIAMLIASPALADEVNIYSHRQPELIQPLLDQFTAETGIDVNIAFVDKGMAERLKAEGSRSPADLVLTVDIGRMVELVDADVLQPVEDAVLDGNIPAEYRDPAHLWFGLTTRSRVVYASADRVKPGEITTYEDLVNPKWKGRLCMRSGLADYNVALTAAYLLHHGADATKLWLEGLKANLAHKPQGVDRDQVKSIWSGECDIALGNTYYIGQMLNDDSEKDYAAAVRIDFPVFAGGGSHMNISGIALTKAAPNKAAALKLMEWLSSDEAQKIYAETNHEFPVKPGVARSALVQSWGPFTPDSLPLADIAKARGDAVKLIEDVDFDG
ncbi:MAG: Fe(3+) ABC transporter substrate-binding protein [Pseudomonadota bacterium]